MNHIFRISRIILVALMFSSCSNVLDLQPAQSLSNQEALSNDASVKQVLIGAYDWLSTSSLYGGEIMRNSELYAGEGEITWLGTYIDPQEIFNRSILVTNYDVESFWNNSYACINTCNNVLSALSVVNEADRNQVEGEAKFMRGMLYFDLARNFGQQYKTNEVNNQLAAPIVLLPSESSTDNASVSRNTVDECYNQAIDDLSQAEDLLPEKNDVYANKYVAAAILARLYLQQGNYEAALDQASMVIGSGIYKLVTNYADEFGQDNNTTEDIFDIQVSTQDGTNAMNLYFSTASHGGRGDVEIEQSFIDSYDPADLRKNLYYKVGNKWRTGKFNNEFGNVTVVRLGEMYLTRAECNERLGTTNGAAPVDDYNKTHTRAGLPAATSVTLDDILAERQLELAHEGLKVFDVKRLHGIIGTMSYDDVKMIYPIPQRDIEINPNLEQNPGY